jgi:hypothetical protein
MARPTKDELINKILNILEEYENTPPVDRTRTSVKPIEYLKGIEMVSKMCGYDKEEEGDEMNEIIFEL